MRCRKGNPSNWVTVIELLSLDLTSHFVKELGIDKFYSDELRQLARAEVAGYNLQANSAPAATPTERACAFQSSVRDELGERVIRAITVWIRQSYEGPRRGDFGDAQLMLAYLVDQWDVYGGQMRLPLNTPEHAHIRIIIRDHVTHRFHIDKEIRRTSGMLNSDWDRQMDERHRVPDWSETSVWIMVRGSGLFWDGLVKLFNQQDAHHLLQWMKHRSKSDVHGGCFDPPNALLRAVEF